MTELPRPPESIETERLLLRGPSLGDAQQLFDSYVQDELVTRFLSWRPHASIDDTRSYIETCAKRWETAPGSPYFIELKTRPGKVIGAIDVRLQATRVGFGYVLSRHQWGHGLMPEALGALLDWSLAQPPIWRAWSMCDVREHRLCPRDGKGGHEL